MYNKNIRIYKAKIFSGILALILYVLKVIFASKIHKKAGKLRKKEWNFYMNKELNIQKGSFPPWSRIDDLAKMVQEAGIDFDQFIAFLKENESTEEMAVKFKVSENAINILKEHFFHYGVNSNMGGD